MWGERLLFEYVRHGGDVLRLQVPRWRTTTAPAGLMRASCRSIAIVAAVVLVGAAVAPAQEGDRERIAAALRGREARLGGLHISAEWRWSRCAADDVRDRARWKPIDFDYDLDYTIVRPWWRVRVVDVTQGRQDPNHPDELYAWFRGELTSLSRQSGEPTAFYAVVNHRNLGTLRGKVFLTPLELEFFDLKETLLEMLSRAGDVRVRWEEGGRVWLEFAHPRWPDGYRLRARLDLSRDAVPLMYECYTTFGGKSKPCTWLMETQDVLAVGSSFVISEALIFNINPNVLPDTEEVIHYKVRAARADPGLSMDMVRIVPREQNSEVFDLPRLERKRYDSEGRLVHFEKLDMEELREQQRAWAVLPEQTVRRSSEQFYRKIAFGVIVGAAGLGTALLGGLLWWRRRRATGQWFPWG
jgi:hypothetical protein